MSQARNHASNNWPRCLIMAGPIPGALRALAESRHNSDDSSVPLLARLKKRRQVWCRKDPIVDPSKKAYSLLEEFKSFAFKGNVIDLAVGVIIGAAFGKIIESLVKNIIMPLVGLLLPGEQRYSG